MVLDLCIKPPENDGESSRLVGICAQSQVPITPTWLERKDYLCLVAMNHDGMVIGGFVCYLSPSGFEADLEVIAVDKPFRKMGVGIKLLERLKGELAGRGIKMINLVPREGTEDYYARNGFSFDGPSCHYMTQLLE